MPREADEPARGDRARIAHMLQTARDALVIVGDDDAGTIAADMIRTRALVNCFTEIGEAAARLSTEGRERAPDVPWRQVVGMRHLIVHVYWNIDLREIIETVHNDLPAFIAALETALATWPQPPEQ